MQQESALGKTLALQELSTVEVAYTAGCGQEGKKNQQA
jgi:hypothetical protein